MSDLLKLAERVEAATGADRELDHWVALAKQNFLTGSFATREKWIAAALAGEWASPRFTASLDAAMTLVPESVEGLPLSFKLERYYVGNGTTKCRASVWCGLGAVSSLDTASEATTPALALTAACLRAIAASKGEQS